MEAAQRIEKMNEASALDLLARLKSKTVGQILASVNPIKAARLSEKLAAGRWLNILVILPILIDI